MILVIFNTLLTLGADSTSGGNSSSGGIINGNNSGEGGFNPFPPNFTFPEGEIPEIPLGPTVPTTGRDVDELGQVRLLEKHIQLC